MTCVNSAIGSFNLTIIDILMLDILPSTVAIALPGIILFLSTLLPSLFSHTTSGTGYVLCIRTIIYIHTLLL